MNLKNLKIEARIRSPWEAIDLGLIMTRQWWKMAFLSWTIPAFVVFAALSLVFSQNGWIATTITWWLKPLWDRGPLYVASRRLFDETVTLREILFKLPELYKVDVLLALTLRRFSSTRSFDLPLTVLEGLRKKERSSRQNILHRGQAGPASWLTIICIHIEAIIVFGLYSFAFMMMPAFVDIDYEGFLFDQSTVTEIAHSTVTFVGMALVGPYYALAGFAMYISRRIELEAWDIEIRFRHLATQTSKATANLASWLLPVLAFGLISLSMPQQVFAEDVSDLPSAFEQPAEYSEARSQITSILSEDNFHQIDTVSGWRVKDFENAKVEQVPDWIIVFTEFLEKLFGSLDGVSDATKKIVPYMEYMLWALVCAILLWLVIRYRNNIQIFIRPPSKTEITLPPVAMFGLDVSRENQPENTPRAVLQLWHKGQHRASVGLLYRGLLSQLIHQHSFCFSDSNTEGECVEIVKKRNIDSLSRYAEHITHCWQSIAYGHQDPSESDIECLCDNWPRIFANA